MNSFYLLSEREYSREQIWLSSVALIVVITLLELSGILRPVRQAGEVLATPFLKVGASITYFVSAPYRIITTNVHSYQKIKDLELRYNKASAQLSEIDSLKSENQELRALFNSRTNRDNPATSQKTVAAILSYGQPQIERSHQEIVQEKALVMLGDTVIGRVGPTSDNIAEVLLLNQAMGATFLVRTESGVSGIAQGNGKDVVVTQLPIQSDVKEGERIVTVGQLGVPADLFVGRVERVEKKAGETTQKAFLNQGVNFYENRFVEVRKTL